MVGRSLENHRTRGTDRKRRDFLKAGAAGTAAAAASTLAAPAIAQDIVQWRMVTAWPKNLPGPGVAAQMLADRITALSSGKIEVKLFASGEIVPGPGVFDAVGQGTAELYHAVPAYWGSKSKGIFLFGSQPFGLTAPEQAGWFRTEINSVDDLKGLKFRSTGLASVVI